MQRELQSDLLFSHKVFICVNEFQKVFILVGIWKLECIYSEFTLLTCWNVFSYSQIFYRYSHSFKLVHYLLLHQKMLNLVKAFKLVFIFKYCYFQSIKTQYYILNKKLMKAFRLNLFFPLKIELGLHLIKHFKFIFYILL